IINGKMEGSVTYRYLLLPQQAGSFPIDNISAVYQNHRYKGNSVTLTVLNQGSSTAPELESAAQSDDGSTRDYFVEASVDNANPYVNQQVTLSLRFYTAVKHYGSPEVTAPQTTGFWTEYLGNKGPYYQKINNRNYKVLEVKYALFPTQTGKLTIGRTAFKAVFATQERRRNIFGGLGALGRGEEVTVRSQPITIEARPLPAEGRPDDFTGTVGRFSMNVTPSKMTVDVNQPVSVVVDISGQGNIKSVAEPNIPENPDFRVYRASSNEEATRDNDRLGGVKRFEEVFIPKRPGTLEIPALTFNYFDPAKGKYNTIRSRPIKLTVNKAEGYAVDPDVPFSGGGMTIGAESRDIRFIKQEPGILRAPGELVIHSPLYLAVNGIPVLALVALVVARRRREKLLGDVGYARARAASKQAQKRLSKARTLAKTETAADFFGETNLAVLSFIADKLNISPHGLTSEKVAELVTDRSTDDLLVRDTVAFLNRCGFARYAPASMSQGDIDEALKTAEDLIVRIEGVRF
ncbi:MAG: BatD family protein, partial [candidate division Zixibacteria bacterium]|nr:BatD family protein [candidate division Zixibacteria bacterium]